MLDSEDDIEEDDFEEVPPNSGNSAPISNSFAIIF
jgi:hypothetical protein